MPKTNKILSLLLVLTLMAPTAVQLYHHHHEFTCNARYEKHFHDQTEQCPVCHFEFSTYITTSALELQGKVHRYKITSDTYRAYLHPIQPKYSFLLRAPPVVA
jgi:hypothetical protein